jgi:hypothetical protein
MSILSGIGGIVTGFAKFIIGVKLTTGLIGTLNMYLPLLIAQIFTLLLIILIPGSVFFIVYGFLRELRIFGRTPTANVWIALTAAMALMVPIPINVLPGWLTSFLSGQAAGLNVVCMYTVLFAYFSGMGWISLVAFAIIYTFGLYYFGLRKMRKWSTTAGVYGAFRGETKNIRKELGEISESIADAAHKLATETNPDKRVALELNLRELQDRRRDIQERLTELREASRNM